MEILLLKKKSEIKKKSYCLVGKENEFLNICIKSKEGMAEIQRKAKGQIKKESKVHQTLVSKSPCHLLSLIQCPACLECGRKQERSSLHTADR